MRFGSCESCTTWWIQHKLFVNDRPQLILRTSKRYRMHRKLVWNSHTQCTPDSHNMHAHKHNHACPYFISLCQFHQSLHRGYVSIDGLITAYEKHASTLHWPWHAHPQWKCNQETEAAASGTSVRSKTWSKSYVITSTCHPGSRTHGLGLHNCIKSLVVKKVVRCCAFGPKWVYNRLDVDIREALHVQHTCWDSQETPMWYALARYFSSPRWAHKTALQPQPTPSLPNLFG